MSRLVIRDAWKEWHDRVKKQRQTIKRIQINPWHHNERWVHNTKAHHQSVLDEMLKNEPRKHYTARELALRYKDG